MRNWLKEARTNKGYTLKQMGDALGVSESYYKLIEDGERQKNMDITLIAKISEISGIPITEIVNYELKIAS